MITKTDLKNNASNLKFSKRKQNKTKKNMVHIDTFPQYLALIRLKVSEKTRQGTDGRRYHDSSSGVQWHKTELKIELSSSKMPTV